MQISPPPPVGIMGSFRTLGDALIASVQDRLELLSLELQEEKFRLVQTIIWISAAVFAGMMAVICASLTVVFLFWESARPAVLCGLTLFYTAAVIAIIVAFRRYLRNQPKPFTATLQELGEDRTCIQTKN